MPARLVLPSSQLGTSESAPLDLEGELRRAVQTSTREALDEDVIEALVSTACEVGETADISTLQEALQSILDATDLEVKAHEALVIAMEAVLQTEGGYTPLPSVLKIPASVAKSRRIAQGTDREQRWATRRDIENERAEEYLRERANQVADEEAEREAHERELSRYYSRGNGMSGAGDALIERAPKALRNDSGSDDDDEVTLKDREVTKRRLRELGEPATLFGEADADRLLRLRQLELQCDQDVLAGGSTNVMQIIDRRAARDESRSHRPDAGLNERDEEDEDPALGNREPEQGADDMEDSEAEGMDIAIKAVLIWLRLTLRGWESTLVARAQKEHNCGPFKEEKAHFRQTKQYLKPLRRSLRDGEINPAVIKSIAAIAELCDKRKYKAAKEAYMRLAIGNNPWPMGVTFVTFHDRANRHKISEDSVAHVLDDETTRKYVQMVKRLVTFCERNWPADPLDPE